MLRWPSLSLRLGLGAQRHWYCWSARSLRLGGGVPGSRHDLVMSIGLSRVRGLVQGPLSAACCRRCPLDLSGPCTSCVATLGSQPLLRVPAGIDRLWALASYTDPGGASCAPSSTQTAEHPPPPSAAPWQRSSPTHPTWSPGFPQPSNAAASGASTRPRFSPCRSPPQPADRAAACLPVYRARSRPGWVHANAGAGHRFGPGPPPPGCVFCWSTTSPQPGPASRPRRVSCEQRGSPWSAPLWWRRHHPEPPVTGSVPRRVR